MAEECCKERKAREAGFDGYDGHNVPVGIVKIKGRWCLNAQDWYTVDINHCPWCGIKFVHDSFGSGEQVESLDESMSDLIKEIESQLNTGCVARGEDE
jgi:hypothetical protein